MEVKQCDFFGQIRDDTAQLMSDAHALLDLTEDLRWVSYLVPFLQARIDGFNKDYDNSQSHEVTCEIRGHKNECEFLLGLGEALTDFLKVDDNNASEDK